MPARFLHEHKDFSDLLRIVGGERKVDPFLVEKDYWIMQVLYGLQQSYRPPTKNVTQQKTPPGSQRSNSFTVQVFDRQW